MKGNRPGKMAELLRDLTRSPASVAAIDEEIREALQALDMLYGLREIAAKAHGLTTPAPQSEVVVKLKNQRQAPPTSPVQELRLVAGSSASVVFDILDRAGRGVSYEELREEYAKSDAGKSMLPHEKPYYYGVQRLKNSGHVVLYKSKLWASHHLKAFRDDVAAGRKQDMPDLPRFRGKWCEAVLAYLRERGDWASTREIAAHLATLPEFKSNKDVFGQVCNAVSTLKHHHNMVERRGATKKSLWRIVGTESPANSESISDDLLTATSGPGAVH
jgi:hypothetical protein